MTLQEAQIIALSIRAKAIEIEVLAMRSHDASTHRSLEEKHTDEVYIRFANDLYSIHDQIQVIARDGGLK